MKLRKPKEQPQRFPEHWEVSDTLKLNGKMELKPDTEFTIVGKRGRYRFIRSVVNTKTKESWIEAISANPQKPQQRAFHFEQINKVFRKRKSKPKVL